MKRHYYIRILFYLSLASLLPNLWIGTVLIRRNEALIRSAGEASALHSLKQLASGSELVLRSIDDTILLFRQNRAFRRYEGFPDKDYFRSFQSHYDRKRISEYAEFLNLRAEINQNLEQLALTRDFIRSVYYYDTDNREVFSLQFIPSPIQSFPHREWYEELQGLREPKIFGPVLNSQRQKVLYMIYPQTIDSSSVFIVDVDLKALYDFLWRMVHPENTELFFVLDSTASPLIYNTLQEKEVYALAWDQASVSDEGLQKILLGNRSCYLSAMASELPGLTFYGLHDEDVFSRILVGNRRFLLLLALPLLSINILLLFLLGRMLYSPINRLMDAVRGEGVENLSGLESWIGRSVTALEKNEKLLKETVPAFHLGYLNRLLDGDGQEGEVDLPFRGGELRILCAFPAQPGKRSEVLEVLSRWGESRGACLCFPKEDLLVLIMESEGEAYGEFCLEADLFLNEMDGDRNLRIYAAISEHCWPVTMLNRGYEEVLIKLKDWIKRPFGSSLAILGSREESRREALVCSGDFADRLLELLKEGRDFGEILDAEFARVDQEEYSASEVQHFYIDMLSVLLTRLRDRRVDSYSTSPRGEDLFVTLVNLRTRDGIHAWFRSLCEEIGQRLRGLASTASAEHYIRQAEVLIEESLGDDLTLASVAEEMGISSFYLSRLFRDVRDESFTEYLTGRRMKRARYLLEDGALKVKDVSRQVGYWSSNYFIKVFRKYYGVTPGEFRRREPKNTQPPAS